MTRPRLSTWRLISLSAWSRPSDPSVYGWLDVELSRTLPFLDESNAAGGPKITLTHLVGKAIALAIADCPSVNSLIRRGQLHARETIDVFFQVAYEGGENLSGAKIACADRKSLAEIAAELAARAKGIRAHAEHPLSRSDARISRIPGVLRTLALRAAEIAVYDLELDLTRFGVPRDAFGSAMVTNVGGFGLPHAFAPLVPFSRVPFVITIGSVRDAAVVCDGAVASRPVVSIGVTLDHRVLDGHQAGKLARRFSEILSNPAAGLSGR